MKTDPTYQAAFLEMLRQNEGFLMKVCLSFTNRKAEDIRDLYQEIACNLWESWPTFRGESEISTWVMRVALNVAGQEVRRWSKRLDFVEVSDTFYANLAEDATDLRYQRLYQLIDHLEDVEDRRLLFLYLDSKPLREISEMTGLTEPAVKQRIYRIKKKLYELNKRIEDE